MNVLQPPPCLSTCRLPYFVRANSSSALIHSISPSSSSADPNRLPKRKDFVVHPDFYKPSECRQLLRAALWKLDRTDRTRRRQRELTSQIPAPDLDDRMQDLFHRDYGFEEGHFDSVIHHFRESLLSSVPPPSTSYPDLTPLLNRAYALLPSTPQIENDSPPRGALTHLLHLAPNGEILPHVDNLDASGGIIVGICLGAERVLRMRRKGSESHDGGEGWDVLLPSGCVYVQSGEVRYEYEHSILPYSDPACTGLRPGHRVSIMIRDAPRRNAKLG